MPAGPYRSLTVVLALVGALPVACTTTTIVKKQPGSEVGTAQAGDGSGFVLCQIEGSRAATGPADDTRCPVGLDCLGGLCLRPTDVSCTPADDGKDGCDEQSICASSRTGTRCYLAPACADGGCPGGSVCNTVLSTKGAVCIADRCLEDLDCLEPGLNRCVRARSTDLVGHCKPVSRVALGGVNGAAAEGESYGCPMEPRDLIGTKPAGAPCGTPSDCRPVCCSCSNGRRALLAAQCDFNKGSGQIADDSAGRCASAKDACTNAPGGINCDAP